ncbi:hypothetical protein BCR41DRAFT_383768 [Lobosporangium transversale]|uniref:C2 domain-containing protein n=1 Tax=Lobosporangium transversale TaxID=64571 RepID=A0A1Y2GYB7_9FUNG|nr:hypothetical protein BCR41DRAFT_383768 [Lobosporangium transversale]ORZ27300.1 hypothetical protein BCR41DRAFT_383768 [Lobosporangium transversale]|eukprot:XP_021885027.1 hypothetical protein BCR41DRAFT_383768 [Lobosporangium transversale]
MTLSSCTSPSATNTGILYLRIKRIEDIVLEAPDEDTMLSVRIDTGREKIDTDYMPWKSDSILFNQEFCLNQIISVEFQTVNDWVDLTDYDSYPSSLPDDYTATYLNVENCNNKDKNNGNAAEGGDSGIIAKILASVCFIPGPEMDPEDAIYEDEDHIPTEPQNLVECQMGLRYFEWSKGSGEKYRDAVAHAAASNTKKRLVRLDFRTDSEDMAEAWVEALLSNSLERPLRPYWLGEYEQ